MYRKSRVPVYSLQGLLFAAIVGIFLAGSGGVCPVHSAAELIKTAPPSSFPPDVVADWKAQDGTSYSTLITSITNSLPAKYKDKVTGSGETGYLNACHWRRVARLENYAVKLKKMIYARHHDIGGMIVGYTEDLDGDGRGFGPWGMTAGRSSDYSNGNKGGTAIHLLEFDDYYPSPKDSLLMPKDVSETPARPTTARRSSLHGLKITKGTNCSRLTSRQKMQNS